MMKHGLCILILLLHNAISMAQRPFTEGTVAYKVRLETTDHKEYKGVYTFTFKGDLVKKELQLSDGYQDVVLYNCFSNTIYSLQNRNGKKYAIQLSMADYQKGQQKFAGFRLKNETDGNRKIAGCGSLRGEVRYTDGTAAAITFTNDWYPVQSITFERFPDAKFFPLSFSYTDEQGMTMEFEATDFVPGPVENAVFRIPPDYRIISYTEYKEMSR